MDRRDKVAMKKADLAREVEAFLPSKNKTVALLAHLAHTPMTQAQASAYLGMSHYQWLVAAGVLKTYTDMNPEYGTHGKKPMCLWVTIGEQEFVARRLAAPDKGDVEYSEQTIARYVRVLRSLGYTVTKGDEQK